ncbi:MAG: prepilin-type N-terminal cleavage/methylation domain-containing protein [Helicobacteraceae bacterium]|nr:prepilin-type N-terminal cleavage/methylation domain-containing protein [Helicobacteraceae bacterium]
MKRSGFSMIELVFVIVILGVLAAVAVPRFVTTRTDAQVAMARSDIASTLKAIPARVFAENLDPTASAPTGFSSWGEWMIDTGGLDRGRWRVGGGGTSTAGNNGIEPIGNVTNSSGSTTGGCGQIIWIDPATGNLTFDPNNIPATTTSGNNSGTFCKGLKESYPSGSNRIIPLATTGAVKF